MAPHQSIEIFDVDGDGDGDFYSTPPSRATTMGNTPAQEDVRHNAQHSGQGDDDCVPLPTGDTWQASQARKTAALPAYLPPGHKHIRYVDAFGCHRIKAGMNVPLNDGSFFRIQYLTQGKNSHNISMHGLLLKRPIEMSAQMGRKRGELALEICVDKQDDRPDLERGIMQMDIESINFSAEKLSREIILTNRSFPELRDYTDRDHNGSPEEHWARGKLICRVKSIRVRKAARDTDVDWVYLREAEADNGYGVSDLSKTLAWLQGKHRQATTSSVTESSTRRWTKRSRRTSAELVEIEESEFHEVRVKRTITELSNMSMGSAPAVTLNAADICCGAGGVSGGMQEAGLRITVGVDKWHPAAATFKKNFPGATTYEQDVSDFVGRGEAKRCTYCHVAHFSLPCQYFSPNHTVPGKNDDKHTATNLVIEDTLNAMRCMYATFENTSGLTHAEHREYYNALIKSLTDLGWSATARVEKLSGYGNSHDRKRLIIVAACPGMPLVDIPPPTHGAAPGLLPLMTVRAAISGIDPTDPLHNRAELKAAQRSNPSNMPRAEFDEPLGQLIDTSGPKALHPSGKRRFTYREGMRLMRFNDWHTLSSAAKTIKDKWTLIGNAVPRDIIVLIYKDIRKELEAWFADVNKPIVLDDDSDADMPTVTHVGQKRKRNAAVQRGTEYEGVSSPHVAPRVFAMPRRAVQHRPDSDGTASSSTLRFVAPHVSTQLPVRDTIRRSLLVRKPAIARPQQVSKPFGDVDTMDLTQD